MSLSLCGIQSVCGFLANDNGQIIPRVNIYNQLGQKVFFENHVENFIDISSLKKESTLLIMISNNTKFRKKLLIA